MVSTDWDFDTDKKVVFYEDIELQDVAGAGHCVPTNGLFETVVSFMMCIILWTFVLYLMLHLQLEQHGL